jgi:hypothetical protein
MEFVRPEMRLVGMVAGFEIYLTTKLTVGDR